MTAALPDVAQAVAVAERRRTPVLGGGRGFGPHGRFARSVGIAEWAAGASPLARRIGRWERTEWPASARPVPESIGYRRLLRQRDDLAGAVTASLAGDEVGPDDLELVRDAAEQVVAVALAAARTGHRSILDDGIAELAAPLGRRRQPMSAVAARLPAAVHAALAPRLSGYPGRE